MRLSGDWECKRCGLTRHEPITNICPKCMKPTMIFMELEVDALRKENSELKKRLRNAKREILILQKQITLMEEGKK